MTDLVTAARGRRNVRRQLTWASWSARPPTMVELQDPAAIAQITASNTLWETGW